MQGLAAKCIPNNCTTASWLHGVRKCVTPFAHSRFLKSMFRRILSHKDCLKRRSILLLFSVQVRFSVHCTSMISRSCQSRLTSSILQFFFVAITSYINQFSKHMKIIVKTSSPATAQTRAPWPSTNSTNIKPDSARRRAAKQMLITVKT